MTRRQLTVRPSSTEGSGNSAVGAKAVSATVLVRTVLVTRVLVVALLAQACSSSPPSETATPEPTATTAPAAEPTATTAPAAEPTHTTAPAAEPTNTTAPKAQPTEPTAVVSECGDTSVPSGILFVWGVADDDPDGGLVAHTGADVDSPVTRVLAPNAVAANQTGNCRLAPNGAPWFELADPASAGFDWVNARYVRQAPPSCLHGEAYGSSTRDQSGTPDANTQLFGPLMGHALAEGERVAFYADPDQLGPQIAPNLEFRWFPADRISVSDQCFGSGSSGRVCLFERVVLFTFLDPEPRVNSNQSVLADRTGRLYARPGERGLREDFVEVTLPGDPGTYWYDPAVTRAGAAPCPADGSAPVSQIGAPGFDMVDCTVNGDGPDTQSTETNATLGAGPLGAGSLEAGVVSHADHVHSMTSHLDGAGCVRLIFELGSGLFSDQDRPARSLPPLTAEQTATSTRVMFGECARSDRCLPFGVGLGEPSSIDVHGHQIRAFVSRGNDGKYAIQVLHPTAESNLAFRENPARIIVDLVPEPDATGDWYGRSPLIAERLRTDIAANETIVVRGWDRPFEAQGQWRVYRIDDVVGAIDETLINTLRPVGSGLYMTADWTSAAGEFRVELPPLDPGVYALLFGSSSPSDGGYRAAGQMIRIYDPTMDPTDLPALTPQVWNAIELTD